MFLKNTRDLKEYISKFYPKLHPKKFDVVKIGWRIYIILITNDGFLAKEFLFRGSLETVNGLYKLKEILDNRIKKVLTKYNFI